MAWTARKVNTSHSKIGKMEESCMSEEEMEEERFALFKTHIFF